MKNRNLRGSEALVAAACSPFWTQRRWQWRGLVLLSLALWAVQSGSPSDQRRHRANPGLAFGSQVTGTPSTTRR